MSGHKVTSLERRRIEQATLGPQLVGAALQLEGRAHAHGALVAFAVVADLLDGVEHPVVGEPHHLAELALGAEQAADLGARRLGLHLLDVLRRHAQRLGGDGAVQHPAHDELPALIAPARHRPLRIVGDDLGQDLVLVGLLELDALAGQRIKFKEPNEHQILTEIISNDPQGPVTRWGDERWQLVVRWVLNGTIAAEALGVTSKNVEEMKAKSASSEVRRLLGAEGKFGQMMGLSDDWMFNAIKQVGNYGESYERTVGMGSPLKLKRGANELWTKGGLLYSPPFQ